MERQELSYVPMLSPTLWELMSHTDQCCLIVFAGTQKNGEITAHGCEKSGMWQCRQLSGGYNSMLNMHMYHSSVLSFLARKTANFFKNFSVLKQKSPNKKHKIQVSHGLRALLNLNALNTTSFQRSSSSIAERLLINSFLLQFVHVLVSAKIHVGS